MNRLSVGVLLVICGTWIHAQSVDEMTHALRMAPGTEVDQIRESIQLVELHVEADPEPGVLLRSAGDVHGVFDVDPAALAAVITDLSAYDEFAPRTVSSDGHMVGVDPPRWRHHLRLSFRVLFFGRDYEIRSTMVNADQHVAAPGARGYVFTLDESVDGQLSAMHGTWYLQPIEMQTHRMTYVRYTLLTDYVDTAVGQEFILNRFSERELGDTVRAFVERAREQQGDNR